MPYRKRRPAVEATQQPTVATQGDTTVNAHDEISSDNTGQQESDWYANYSEIVAFAYVLVDADYLPAGQKEVVYYLEKPWKWTEEHRIWAASGRPNSGDEPAWEIFLRHLEAADNNQPPVIGI